MDGAVLEGVGQVIRNCSAYAAILGTFVYLKNIRVRRHRPGLRLQYVEGLEVVARFSNCALQAAATSLLLQVALPVLFTSSARDLLFTGEASVVISPSVDYMKFFKVSVDINILLRDFIPRSDSLCWDQDKPFRDVAKHLLDRQGPVVGVSLILYGYSKADHLFIDEVRNSLLESLKSQGLDMDVGFMDDMQGMEDEAALVCQLLIYAETSTGCILGASSRSGDHHELAKTGEFTFAAVSDLGKQLEDGDCTDEYLQDQLIIFMALADGVSEIVTGPVTDHTKHALHYAQIMIDAKFEVTPQDGGKNLIGYVGIGH
ncbi:uncharacterized protein [Physcomitrium patens]|uniref:uncharacterized protein n=1 Tax=Physcomitrium patens TaxID=3218 RepID=UPI000D17D78B|nr:RNA 3'-terminal phosphate cyclase-like [Physcomitrium patens]|eukprot:XP_024392360.1 RNA 3'-terminal phosphate cyclase-like [Physcomitrella patens]